MADLNALTVCFLGAGNLGLPILQSLVKAKADEAPAVSIKKYNVCVRSQETQKRLADKFKEHDNISITRGDNPSAVKDADVVILAVDPADVASTLADEGINQAISSNRKLLISVAAGWSRQNLESALFGSPTSDESPNDQRAWVLRALPNIAAQVGESMTAIEVSKPTLPDWALQVADAIFSRIGATAQVPPSLMDATTAVAGSTPAFFAVICDALIDASVAVGVPRPMAQKMIFQSMLGTATMMRDGLHPGLLKDQGTSPEGCTIGGLMVLEEGALRGTLGRGLREAVTVARRMGQEPHVNDTRR